MSIWTKEKTLASIQKNVRGEHIVIKEVENKTGKYVDVRNHFTADDGTLRPTTKGICIPVAKLSIVAETLNKFLAEQ